MAEQDHRPQQALSPQADKTLEDRLANWLNCFSRGSVKWGLVDCWRDDGSNYKRHGIEVTLDVEMSTILVAGKESLGLRRLREAIDLAQLVLAVQPTAIRPVLEKKQERYSASETPTYLEELEAIARGVPVGLQLYFMVDEESLGLLKVPSAVEGIKMLDEELSSDDAFLVLRQELMARVESDHYKLLQLNSMTVPVVCAISAWCESSVDPSEARSMAFLDNLTALSEALDIYQRGRASPPASMTIATRHVRFEIIHILQGLDHLFLSSQIVELVMKLMTMGIPVKCYSIQLDLRFVSCDEDQLREFLAAVAERSNGLFIQTAIVQFDEIELVGFELFDPSTFCIDWNGQDYRELIRMILRALGSVRDHVYSLDLGGWLKACERDHNREAIWRGLIEDVLSTDMPCRGLYLTGLLWIISCTDTRTLAIVSVSPACGCMLHRTVRVHVAYTF